MKHVTAILFCLLTVAAMAAENHVRCIEPYSPSREEPAPYYDLSRVTTSYFDGLGRLIESVDEGAGGDFENVYALTVYGRGGEVMQKWQPVGLHSGFVAAPALKSATQSFYGCSNPYAALFYDLSEDMRTSATIRPGAKARALTEHDLCYDGEIPMFFVNASGKLERKGHYAEGSLLLKASTDESLLTRYTYTDFSGRKVAEMAGDAWTFWAYDVCGRLRYIVSPEGSERLAADGVCADSVVYALCSEMAYDGQGRMVMSRPQGVAPTLYVYDCQDRLVCEQDGHLRQTVQMQFPQGEWQNDPDEVCIDRRYTYMTDGGKIYMDEIRVDGGKWQRSIYDYDSAGRLVGKRGSSGGDETYALDVQGRLLTAVGASLRESLTYLNNGMVEKRAMRVPYDGDTIGSSMEYLYGEQGFLLGGFCESPLYDSFKYDLNGNIVRHDRGDQTMVLTDYEGNRVKCVVDTVSMADDEYDGTGDFLSRVDCPMAYDSCGRIVADKLLMRLMDMHFCI